MEQKLKWERVEETLARGRQPTSHGTFRAAVPGGWLVAIWSDGAGQHGNAWGGGLAFVPDPDHHWLGGEKGADRNR